MEIDSLISNCFGAARTINVSSLQSYSQLLFISKQLVKYSNELDSVGNPLQTNIPRLIPNSTIEFVFCVGPTVAEYSL